MVDSLGILGYDTFHFIVGSLARSRRFYTKALGFTEVARASEKKMDRGGEEASVFGADPNWGRILATVGARAGSRGWDVDPFKAQTVGLIPRVLERTVQVGNTSLRARLANRSVGAVRKALAFSRKLGT